MIEKKILVKNIEVNYKVFGEGKSMLILHGWRSSSDRWQKAAELLAEKGVKVIVPDLPGFGLTPEPKMSWNLDNYVEWVRELSEKIPELNKSFYLLGHSFGGAVSVKFAIKYNQKVEKLFLVAAACIRKKTFLKKVLYGFSKFIKIFSFLPYYQLARKAFYKFIIKKSDYIHFSGIMQEIYLRIISEDLSQRLSFVKIPTIIIWGDADESTPIEQAHFINKKIEKSKLIIIPKENHALQIKVPELLTEKILDNLPSILLNGEILSLKNII